MDYKKINDYEVVYMVRENDEEAREIIFNKYIPIVRRIASDHLALAKMARIEYEDLVQEGLIALNEAINKYNERSGVLFYTFLCVCVERRILTYCRKMNSSKHYLLNTSLDDEYIYSVSDNDVFEAYFNEINLERKFVSFKNLFDIVESNIFELRYNGFSYKEISKLLDIPVSTIDGKLCKIRRILKETLNNTL
ncbi:MAG: sigma-70 family RNA polymerase sigma factor [Tenericutes bacterium]|nr:sigma-70 family RNA polymerase sigma factor [Mycoplasmatota bacterium]